MASAFGIVRIARDLGEVLTNAARAPGWLPGEERALVGAATALDQARKILLADIDNPELRRRRVFGTPQPPAVRGEALTTLQAAAALGITRMQLIKRLERAGAPKVDGRYRVSTGDLERLRSLR